MPFAGIGCGCKDIEPQGCRRDFKEKPQLLQDYKNTENSKIIQNPVMDALCHFGRVGEVVCLLPYQQNRKYLKLTI